jgi:outer membrane protein assembly factor BamD (BamD/ComL family)
MSTEGPGSGSAPPRWQTPGQPESNSTRIATDSGRAGHASMPPPYAAPPSQSAYPSSAHGQPGASSQPFAQTAGVFQAVTPLQPGVVLNNTHRVDQMLGRGGMGEVYRGTNVHTGDQVAIKVIRPELVDDGHMRDLFLREAMALRKIRHPAIVSYEGASADASGRLYLVMDFVEGPSLAQFVTQRPLTPAEMRGLRRRVAEGLQAAHDQNVVHRDLSPDNIILRGGDLNQATIIDFGIARRTDAAKTSLIGQSFAGKVEYAAPEQFGMYTGAADARSDIYTLGLVLVAAVQGHPLDMGTSPVAAIDARKKVPDLSRVPPELRPGLTRMLEPDPAARPQSMRDVAALDALDAAGGQRAGGGLHVALLVGGLGLAAAIGGAFVFADPVAMVSSLFGGGATAAETQAWQRAREADAAAGYQAFLGQYPGSRYAAEARQLMAAAQQREFSAREDANWRQATETDTAESYRTYLAQHPRGPHAPAARDRLAAAQQREAGTQEAAAWRQATQADTAAAYRAFLAQYPNGRSAAEARQRLAAAEQRDAAGQQDEEQLWRRAEAANTPAAMREYLQRYPTGRHAEAAQGKLAELQPSVYDVRRTWSEVACDSIPLWSPAGFTCQVSSDYPQPARYRSYMAGGTVGGWQTQVWMHAAIAPDSYVQTMDAARALPRLNTLTHAGTDWSAVLNYGGADYMTFRHTTSNCVAMRKPGPARGQGYAYVFTAVQCAPPGAPLYPNDIRTTIDGVRVK